MLLYSMGVSVDGFIADRHGAFDWGAPSKELFAFHLERVRGIGAHLCGRKLYETMLVWENDPAMRHDEASIAFADVWTALPKVVFSRSQPAVQGNARLAEGSITDELARLRAESDRDVEIGGAMLAAEAVRLDLVDEFHIFRYPVLVGGGNPFFPAFEDNRALQLVDTRTFDGGVIYELYRRDR